VHLVEISGLELGGKRADHVHERRERDAPAVELNTPADERSRAGLAGLVDQVVYEPRLAHAGLSADQDGRLLAGDRPLERAAQQPQLPLASDQDGAHKTRRHPWMIPDPAVAGLRT
jgi:hypothetical protein